MIIKKNPTAYSLGVVCVCKLVVNISSVYGSYHGNRPSVVDWVNFLCAAIYALSRRPDFRAALWLSG